MIDLSRSTDPDLGAASRVLRELVAGRTQLLMVVGATARNILALDLGAGRPARGTRDVDVAVVVDSWSGFDAFTRELEPIGESGHKFRVLGVEVDVVPCGGVEAGDRTVLLNSHRINLLGIRESFEARQPALLPGGLEVAVASVSGLAVQKVVAWSDRRSWTTRDAVDLATILGWQTVGPCTTASSPTSSTSWAATTSTWTSRVHTGSGSGWAPSWEKPGLL